MYHVVEYQDGHVRTQTLHPLFGRVMFSTNMLTIATEYEQREILKRRRSKRLRWTVYAAVVLVSSFAIASALIAL